MAKDPDFLSFKAGADGYVENPHQQSRLHFHRGPAGGPTATWTSGLAIPIYWATLFSARDFTATGAVVDGATALAELERRDRSFRGKLSPLLATGFVRFADWVRARRADRVELDLAGLEPARHAPLLAAVAQLVAFADDASDDPGPLPPRDDASLGWKTRRNGPRRLEAFAPRLHWPDEVPVLAYASTALLHATVGMPPLGDGPWPEWRVVAGDPDEIRARGELVREAVQSCPNETELRTIGNLEGIARMRAHHRSNADRFCAAARRLADTAKAFADRHGVADDTHRWATALADAERWRADMEATFDRQDLEVHAAMRAAAAAPPSDRELDLDRFPTGDDPF